MNHNHFQRCLRVALAALLFLFSHPALAATIVVDETTCTLVDAITAANTDTATGGCPAGSGPDTIELTADVALTEADNSTSTGDNGLPVVDSEIIVEGEGFLIEREAGAPPFRIVDVSEDGTLTLRDVKLHNGHALVGGGIENRGTVTVTNSTVSGSYAGSGGGISTGNPLPFSPTLILTNSTVSNNSATHGGGIFFDGGLLILTNSTLSGNSAGMGGAIYVFNYALDPVTLAYSTVSGNATAVDWSGAVHAPGGHETTLIGSIVGNNAGKNCYLSIPGDNNFADDDSCGPGFASITPGVDFDTTLADNGGPTLTHALLPWSVAIDAAGECGLDTDQRGFSRDDGACDSGAFEFQGSGDGGGAAVPASSPVGLLALLAILLTTSWAILRPKSRTRRPT